MGEGRQPVPLFLTHPALPRHWALLGADALGVGKWLPASGFSFPPQGLQWMKNAALEDGNPNSRQAPNYQNVPTGIG